MKTRHCGHLALLLGWLALSAASARGDVILSTLPQTNDGLASATLGPLRIKALAFTLSDQAYTMDSAVLRLRLDTFDRPLTTPILQLLNDSGDPDIPGSTVLATFSTPTLVGGINDFTFTPTSPFTLLAGQEYWLALSSAADFDTSGLNWLASNPPVTPTGVATLSGNRFTSDGGVTWGPSTTVNSFTINGTIATVIPEPSTLALAAMGGVGLLGYGCRRRRRA
ncbi:choice-of-anchor R domain-containing protein [Tautonia plasticadhaerens]|uniref:Ice-binding protein C-terminal domain-containing protein n=1 Tax=Tautonia plasticadhaerens TaxID=2527974 RepID=A0A518HFJ2_9BACT|nr:choice-of-anchor R domain-containing protein [Tautonia plasticadhaerens]QDV39614.1 hypothetical protein ElP_75850 [Tautonia plasticadhaerens]